MRSFCILTLALVIGCFPSYAQEEEYPYPSLSPKGKIYQVVGNTELSIEYERPSARKRKIYGGLVPWNKVWRTGAGHCTKIRFSEEVVMEGQRIQSGTYSLFSIPGPEEWIIILNADTTLYGSYQYDAHKDIARFVVIPTPAGRYFETLTFDIDLLPNNARIYLSWTNVQVSFLVETGTDQMIEAFIQTELMTGENSHSDLYAGASEYFFYQGKNFGDAIELTEKALALDPQNGWARSLKIRLFERLKLWDQALEEIDKTIRRLQSQAHSGEEEVNQEIKQLKSDYQRILQLKK